MRPKRYIMQSMAMNRGKKSPVKLPVEFEDKRAFVVWDSLVLGNFELKARVEINPSLLMPTTTSGCDFVYRGRLVLPRPEDN